MGEINRIHHCVQWRQENPSPRAHHSSGKQGLQSFPLGRWTRGLGYSCSHVTPVMDFFSHTIWLVYCNLLSAINGTKRIKQPSKQFIVSLKWICKNDSPTTVSKFVEDNNSFYTLARPLGHWAPPFLVLHNGIGQFTLHLIITCLKYLNKCLKTNLSVYTMCILIVLISTFKKTSYDQHQLSLSIRIQACA